MNQRPQGKGLKLFKVLALAGFMIDIITVGAIFVVLGHDVGGPLECTSTNGLCGLPLNYARTNHDPNTATLTLGLDAFSNPHVVCTDVTTFGLTLTAKHTVEVAGQYAFQQANGTANTADTINIMVDTHQFTFAAGTVAPCNTQATEVLVGSAYIHSSPNNGIYQQTFFANDTLTAGTYFFTLEFTSASNIQFVQFGVGNSYLRALSIQ